MVLSIIVILVLATQTNSENDHLLYVQKSYVIDGPYVKTGEVDGRPEYDHKSNISKIMFRDNEWVILKAGDTWYTHPNQSLTPPETDWLFLDEDDDMYEYDLIVFKVPVTPPPLVLSIQGDSIAHTSNLYTLSDISYNGYPLYNSSQGHIAVEGNTVYDRGGQGDLEYYYYCWYWQDNVTGKKVQLTYREPPPYTPAGWGGGEGWKVEETENNTIVLSPLPGTLFCSTDDGGYLLSLSNPTYPLCDHTAGDHILYLQGIISDTLMYGPYEKTAIVEGRPEYEDVMWNEWIIQFRNSQWEIRGPADNTLLFNPKQSLTPPTTGWRSYIDGSDSPGFLQLDKLFHKVPVTPPPPVISLQGDSIPQYMAGLYTLSDKPYNGYPLYNSTTG